MDRFVSDLSDEFVGSVVRLRLRVVDVEFRVTETPVEPNRFREPGGDACKCLVKIHIDLIAVKVKKKLSNIIVIVIIPLKPVAVVIIGAFQCCHSFKGGIVSNSLLSSLTIQPESRSYCITVSK